MKMLIKIPDSLKSINDIKYSYKRKPKGSFIRGGCGGYISASDVMVTFVGNVQDEQSSKTCNEVVCILYDAHTLWGKGVWM